MIQQMKVRGLMFDPYNNAYIVVLRDEDNAEMLPIWVGKSEASAISFALEQVTAPRPMTHDLMKAMLDAVDAKVISIVVSDLNDNTYYAKIHLMYEDSEYAVDSRPSDAIALALRAKAPIFAAESVIRKQTSEELEQWLENLKPEDFGREEA
ncbi:MAG: bifunctional nuclease family protein [Nitrospirales bacterium]